MESSSRLKDSIALLKKEVHKALKEAETSKEVEELKVRYLGKKGPISSFMKSLKDYSQEERPIAGEMINALKEETLQSFDQKLEKIKQQELLERLSGEKVDISLPGRAPYLGRMHPISQMLEKMISILKSMGFSVIYTPELESEYYNYSGLNYPEEHPARDMQDTYYVNKETLLRSHTTSFQQHVMEKYNPPIRMIAPGKCYRNETISSRSHVIFHQIDVLYIDKHVTFGDLLASLEEFYSKLFNENVKIRVRASYFPFVEPGIEVDVSCTLCKGKGCRLCKDSGWLEVCGAGMVHPEVLKGGGLDPDEYTGFAWGGGVERVYLLLHGVNDIRLFTENDLRFLEQFP